MEYRSYLVKFNHKMVLSELHIKLIARDKNTWGPFSCYLNKYNNPVTIRSSEWADNGELCVLMVAADKALITQLDNERNPELEEINSLQNIAIELIRNIQVVKYLKAIINGLRQLTSN